MINFQVGMYCAHERCHKTVDVVDVHCTQCMHAVYCSVTCKQVDVEKHHPGCEPFTALTRVHAQQALVHHFEQRTRTMVATRVPFSLDTCPSLAPTSTEFHITVHSMLGRESADFQKLLGMYVDGISGIAGLVEAYCPLVSRLIEVPLSMVDRPQQYQRLFTPWWPDTWRFETRTIASSNTQTIQHVPNAQSSHPGSGGPALDYGLHVVPVTSVNVDLLRVAWGQHSYAGFGEFTLMFASGAMSRCGRYTTMSTGTPLVHLYDWEKTMPMRLDPLAGLKVLTTESWQSTVVLSARDILHGVRAFDVMCDPSTGYAQSIYFSCSATNPASSDAILYLIGHITFGTPHSLRFVLSIEVPLVHCDKTFLVRRVGNGFCISFFQTITRQAYVAEPAISYYVNDGCAPTMPLSMVFHENVPPNTLARDVATGQVLTIGTRAYRGSNTQCGFS